jgi:hypothetical protein
MRRILITAAVLILLTAGVVGINAQPGYEDFTTVVNVDPIEVALGGQVAITATTTNTGGRNMKFAMDILVQHPCLPNGAYLRIAFMDQVSLGPGESISLNAVYQPGCLGSWEAASFVSGRGNNIFRETETHFTVKP